jgi:two-component system chemotaxis response regulator CheB
MIDGMPDNGCDLVVVGASAGGVEALSTFARHLPRDFAAPVLVVLHLPAFAKSVMPDILSRAGPLPASHARDGEPLEGGRIYVSPPNVHLVVEDGRMRLDRGPTENGHRPAVDPLFRSAAREHGERVAGVVLSGALDDGAAGLAAIRDAGGATLVQDPDEAMYPSMPEAAIAYVGPDYVLPLGELADVLVRLTSTAGPIEPGREEDVTATKAPDPAGEHAQPGELAPFVCPECGGNLWESEENGVVSYRCRIGHGYSLEALDAENGVSVERALWTAFRALEERSAMSRRVARRLAERGRSDSAARFERQAASSARQAAELKQVLDRMDAPSTRAANR